MADRPDSSNDAALGSRRGSTPSTPSWVKVFGIVAMALALLVVVLHLTGNSPRGHTPSDRLGGRKVLQGSP